MQRLLLFISFMALGTGMIYFLAVQETPPEEPLFSDIPTNVLAMEGVEIREHEGSALKLVLFARRAEFHESSSRAVLRSVRFKVYGEGEPGKPQLVGRASGAVLNKRKGWVVLIGEVRISNSEGTQIGSEQIEYNQKTEIVVSPGEAWVTTGGVTHRGASLIYEIPRNKITFTSPVFYQ